MPGRQVLPRVLTVSPNCLKMVRTKDAKIAPKVCPDSRLWLMLSCGSTLNGAIAPSLSSKT
jgi:hypothetical protein